MKPRRILAAEETREIIDTAVGEHAITVVSVQQDDGWSTFKSRFLERDPARKFFVLDQRAVHGTTPVPLIAGQYVGISFRNRSRKVMFATVVEARGRYMIGGGEAIPAIRYRWPACMTELQRRAYFRTPVPSGVYLHVNAWPGGASARAAAQGAPLSVVSGEAVDLSCGGTLVRVSQISAPQWTDDQTVGLELHLPDGRGPIALNAHYRGARHEPDGSVCLALQFVGLELSNEGRAALTRMARCVQKFHRQMLASESRSGPIRFEL